MSRSICNQKERALKKKAFTLVELLAIIVIIGVVALIVTPIVLGTIANSRKNAFERSIDGLIESVRIDYSDDDFMSPREYYYEKSDLLLLTVNEGKRDELVEINGKIDGNGFIHVDGKGKIIIDKICNTEYCASTGEDGDIEVTPNEGGELTEFDKYDPVISLIGESPIYVNLGETYKEQGVYARTSIGDRLEYTTEIFYSGVEVGTVDTNKEGTYTIKYSASNNDKTVSISRTVIVVDMTPEITMTEENDNYVKTQNVMMSVSAIQPNQVSSFTYEVWKDGTSIEKATVSSTTKTITLNSTGIYEVVVSVTDNKGHRNTLSKTYLIDSTKPTIEVPASTIVKVTEITTYDLKIGITYSDNTGEIPTLTYTGALTSTLGNQIITYTVTDSAGNYETVDRTITVVEADGPILNYSSADSDDIYITPTTIIVTAVDNSNLKTFTYEVMKNGISQGVKNVSVSGKSAEANISLSETGSYTIKLTAVDQYGTSNSITSGIYLIDNTKPIQNFAIDSEVIGSNSWYKALSIKIIGEDSHSGVATIKYCTTTSSTCTPTTSATGDTAIVKLGSNKSVQKVCAQTIDKIGKASDVTCSNGYKVDTTVPTHNIAVASSTAGSNSWYKALSLSVTGTDEHSGISTIKYCTTTGSTCTPNTTYSSAVALGSNASAQRICAQVTNGAGIVSTTTCNGTYLVDATNPSVGKPAIASSTAGSNGWYKALSIKATGSDSHSKVASMKYCTTTSNTCTPKQAVTGATATVTLSSNASAQRVCFVAIDKSGRETSTPVCSDAYKVDTTVPTHNIAVASSTAGSNNWYKALSFSVSGTDAHSGISTIKYCTTTGSTCTPNSTYSSATALGSNASAQRICAQVTNGSGITSTTTCIGPYLVDATNPSVGNPAIASSTAGSNGWYKALSIKATGSDSHSTVATMKYCITTSSTCTPSTSVNGATATVTLSSNASARRVCFIAIDKSGRSTATPVCSLTYKVDTSNPTITRKVSSHTITQGDSYAVTNLYTVSYGVSGGSTVCKNGSTTVTNLSSLAVGSYTLTCTATNGNGNTANVSISVTVNKRCSEGTYAYYSCSSSGYKIYRRYNECAGSYQTETRTGEYCESASSCGSYGECKSDNRQYRTCYYYYGGSRHSYEEWTSCTYVAPLPDFVQTEQVSGSYGSCLAYGMHSGPNGANSCILAASGTYYVCNCCPAGYGLIVPPNKWCFRSQY